MKKLLISLTFLTNTSIAQVFIQTDLGNNIWGLPNIGIEYQHKNNAFTLNGLYKRKVWVPAWFLAREISSEGFSSTLNYKRFIGRQKQSFVGVSVNYSNAISGTFRDIPDYSEGNYNYQLILRDSHFLVRPFVGFQTNRKKRLIGEFGIGGGVGNYYNKIFNLEAFEGNDLLLNPTPKIQTKIQSFIDKRYPKREFSIAPYISAKLLYRISKK
jgi:hypothetical protein